MAKGPAVVFVARHGARLDAADKTWHLTSPTPYDPPLTYGGWSQAKALGLRIAALLDQRDHDQLEAARNGANADLEHLEFSKLDASRAAHADVLRPKKKRKIIIHSSPYLRCIQTSTAVAAGISQYQSPATPHLKVPEPPVRKEGQRERSSIDTSPKTKAMASKVLMTVEPLADPNLEVYARRQRGPEKILLRIDAFLGEWLSPDYYEDITPPPNSTMMVAGAKADLLRRGDYIQQMANTKSSRGFFPGGWMGKSAASSGSQSPAGGASPTLGSLASVSPFRDRSSSQGSSSLQRTKSRENVAALAHPPPKHRSGYLYEAPMPSYSVSPADPIPRGYAAHAREACILVDFQWDSMRPPQEWGDGGEYGDEWSTMHKRFRKGLAGMMNWYREHGTAPPKEQIRGFMFKEPLRLTPAPLKHAPSDPFPTLDGTVEAEDEEELVLVLITHGAGCNALLGAISNQPVLVDVGLASLSMAVRCAYPRKPSVSTIHERRLSVADPGMSDTYEMKLLASVDHLKPGVDPSRPQTPSQVRSPVVLPSPSLESRRRFTGSSGANSPLDSPFSIGEPFRSWNSSLGSMRRTMSSGSNKAYMSSNLNPSGTASPASSTGLWSSPKITPTITNSTTSVTDASTFPNLQNPQKPALAAPSRANTSNPAVDDTEELANGLSRLNTNEQKEMGDSVAPLRTGTAANSQKKTGNTGSPGLWGAAKPQAKPAQGLWGPPRLDDVYEHGRGPKRRWTVTAREEAG